MKVVGMAGDTGNLVDSVSDLMTRLNGLVTRLSSLEVRFSGLEGRFRGLARQNYELKKSIDDLHSTFKLLIGFALLFSFFLVFLSK